MRGVSAAVSQCGGVGEADVMLEHDFEELPCALSGHIISKDLSIMAHCILTKYELTSTLSLISNSCIVNNDNLCFALLESTWTSFTPLHLVFQLAYSHIWC
ncbi:hypothetical protein LINPERHAP2_LOCUS31441 [Linum perenne]